MNSCVVGYKKRPAILGIPGQHDNPPQTKGAPVPDQTTKEEKSAQPMDRGQAEDVAEAVRLVEAWNHAAAAVAGAEVQRLRAEDYKRQRDDARQSLASMTDVATKAQAEAERYRDRCPVTAADVEAAGATRDKCEAWLAADGWSLASHPSNKSRTWQKEGAPDSVTLAPNSPTWPTCLSERIAVTVMLRAFDLGRPAFDILDEMAAMTAEDA